MVAMCGEIMPAPWRGRDRDRTGGELEAECPALGRAVGGADGPAEVPGTGGGQGRDGRVDAGTHQIHVQALTDGAGAAHRHQVGGHAQPPRGAAAHGVSVLEPHGARGGVRLAGVDHHGAHLAAPQGAVALHGRGRQGARRVHQPRRRGAQAGQHAQVEEA